MNFGIEFSELFLDSLEKAGDIQSKINLHNNHVGRMVRSPRLSPIYRQFFCFYEKLFYFISRLWQITCKFGANVMACRAAVS